MSSSTDKRFSEEDRLHFRAKKTRKLADAFVTFEASIERSRPSGVTVGDAFDGLAEEANYSVDRAFSKLVPTVQQSQPASSTTAQKVQTGQPQQTAQQSSAAASSASPLDEAVATIPADVWKGPTSKGSFWIFSDAPEAAKLVALLKSSPKQTLATTQHKFVLSAEGNRFVNRWASKK